MVASVVVDTCGRCGTSRPGSVCSACRLATAPQRLRVDEPLHDVTTARSAAVVAAVLVDLVVVAGPALLLWVLLAADPVTRRSGAAGGVAVVVAVVLLGATVVSVLDNGRAVGGLLLGARVVDVSTGQPVRLGRLVGRLVGGARPGLVWCAVRAGRDPARDGLVDRTDVVGVPDAPAVTYPLAYTHKLSFFPLRLSDGRTARVEEVLLVGRDPDGKHAPPGRTCSMLVWPDLSRRLARTHLLVERDGWALYVTGLAGGTTIVVPDGTRIALEPWSRTRVEVGSVLRVGGRELSVLGAVA